MVQPFDDEVWEKATEEERAAMMKSWYERMPNGTTLPKLEQIEMMLECAALCLCTIDSEGFTEDELIREILEEQDGASTATEQEFRAAFKASGKFFRVGARWGLR